MKDGTILRRRRRDERERRIWNRAVVVAGQEQLPLVGCFCVFPLLPLVAVVQRDRGSKEGREGASVSGGSALRQERKRKPPPAQGAWRIEFTAEGGGGPQGGERGRGGERGGGGEEGRRKEAKGKGKGHVPRKVKVPCGCGHLLRGCLLHCLRWAACLCMCMIRILGLKMPTPTTATGSTLHLHLHAQASRIRCNEDHQSIHPAFASLLWRLWPHGPQWRRSDSQQPQK